MNPTTGDFEGTFIISDSSTAQETLAAIDIITGISNAGIPVLFPQPRFASQIGRIDLLPAIIIGCSNPFTLSILSFQNEQACIDSILYEAMITIRSDPVSNIPHLFVLASTPESIRIAGIILKDFSQYSLQGTTVHVTGTVDSPIVITDPAPPTTTGTLDIAFVSSTSLPMLISTQLTNLVTATKDIVLKEAGGDIGTLRINIEADATLLSDGYHQFLLGTGAGILEIDYTNGVLTILALQFGVSEALDKWMPSASPATPQLLFILNENGVSLGTIQLQFSITRLEDDFWDFILSDNTIFGTATVNIDVDDVATPDLTLVRNSFLGEVTDDNGNFLNDFIVATVNDDIARASIIGGRYVIELTSSVGSEIKFFIRGRLAGTALIEAATDFRDLNFVIDSSPDHYRDEDFDGIPDDFDQCLGSLQYPVTARGCDCEQLNCQGLCILQAAEYGSRPVCGESCIDGIQNQGETGIDCGGPCNACVTCATPNTCMDQPPRYCTEDLRVVTNCAICGCPSDFACEADGQCYKTVELKPLQCMTNHYEFGQNLDCSEFENLGEEWATERVSDYVKASVHGLPSVIANHVEHKVNNMLQQWVVCVKTQKGCVLSDVECPKEELLTEKKPQITRTIKNEFNKRARRQVPGWASLFGTKVSARVDISSFSLTVPTADVCEPARITPETGCKNLISNGPLNEKADILFISDGFFSDAQLTEKINILLDYGGVSIDTNKEGLFSREPLQSNKEKFNIWYLHGDGNIKYNVDFDNIGDGARPNEPDVLKLATLCPQADYLILLSNRRFRSYSWGEGKPFFVSLLTEDSPGRILTHEFGHSFAGLEDEYFNLVGNRDSNNVLEDLFTMGTDGPNCKPTQMDAQRAWSDLITSEGNIGYFESCGGDGEIELSYYLRPTINSIMNKRNQNKENSAACLDNFAPQCRGPPFDAFYAVNDREIQRVLDTFS